MIVEIVEMCQEDTASLRDNLTLTSRKLFFEQGFAAVTMRDISKHSNVPLSTIYNYFANKRDLCRAVLQPVDRGFKQLVEQHFHREEQFNFSSDFHSKEFVATSRKEILLFAHLYRDELRFMHRFSDDQWLEEYWKGWEDMCLQKSIEYMNGVQKRHPHINAQVSKMFLRRVTNEWMKVMMQVALDEEHSESEVEKYLDEYLFFHLGGFMFVLLYLEYN